MAEEALVKPGWAIGIDLGTVNTRVAVFRNDRLEVIPDADGSLNMPSIVSFLGGAHLIGSVARSQLSFNLQSTVFNIKRLIGQNFNDAEAQARLKKFPFHLSSKDGKLLVDIEWFGDTKRFTVVELLSMVLAKAKENAETYLEAPVRAVVISVPTFWKAEERNILLDAAAVAGLDVSHSILASSAAAIACAHNPTTIGGLGEKNVLIFDLGADYLNTALANFGNGLIEIMSVGGDYLGGEDFVNRLVSSSSSMIKRRWNVDIMAHERPLWRLRMACEAAIWELSSAEEANINVDSLFEGRDFHSVITRARFDYLCDDLFRRTLPPIDRVLLDAKLNKSQIHHILLVGGASRIPRVQKLVRDYFNGKEPSKTINPDEAEVYGLAIMAAIQSGEASRSISEILLLDVLPSSVGIETAGGTMSRIIHKNTPIPTLKDEILEISPSTKLVCFYEGERARTKDNRLLAEVDLSPLQQHEFAEDEVLVKCVIKVDHKLKISCVLTEMVTGKSIEAPLGVETRLSEEVLSRMVAEAEYHKEADKHEAARIKARDGLERRIASVREWLLKFPSAYTGNLLTAVDGIRAWVDSDENQAATAYEYEQRGKELDDIQRIMPMSSERGELSEKLPAKTANRLHQARQLLPQDSQDPLHRQVVRERGPIRAMPESAILEDSRERSSRFSQSERMLQELEATGESSNRTRSEPASVSEQFRGGQDTNVQLELQSGSHPAVQPEMRDIPSISKPPTPKDMDIGPQESLSQNYDPSDGTLEILFPPSRAPTQEPFTDAQFDRISTILRNSGRVTWSKVPRLYTVLRLIEKVDTLEMFLAQGITDIWFPFTNTTLPSTLQPSVQADFLAAQTVVLSKAFNLENGSDREHAHFSGDEHLPFQVIGRLGRGAHGSVDKVMSTISHRQYARKMFKKNSGLRREDIRTFITELAILKRVQHNHCVKLLGSYSDSRYFALIIEPVGDYNLADYYHRARGNADMLSLLRSFFGCLADAVRYLHGIRIRHRDIKPQNILVKDDCVLLADFGIAYNWENLNRGTTTADLGKTPVYAAPEVVRIEACNDSIDIWSLGCVFLEMVVVLKGETVDKMREEFCARSDSYSFQANRAGIDLFLDRLGEMEPLTDNAVLMWAKKMLKHIATERPTAAELFEDIVTECKESGIPFCGPCCYDAPEPMTEDDDDSYLWAEVLRDT